MTFERWKNAILTVQDMEMIWQFKSFIQSCAEHLSDISVFVDWNALPGSLRSIVERSRLKLKFRPKSRPEPYYGIELTRWSGMLLSRIRCGNSDLNANLYRRNLVESPMCECGETAETEIHYLLHCQNHVISRRDAKRDIPVGAWNTRDLLHGSRLRYTGGENRTICLAVQQFILSSGRFTT